MALLLLSLAGGARAFYLPGVAPIDYEDGACRFCGLGRRMGRGSLRCAPFPPSVAPRATSGCPFDCPRARPLLLTRLPLYPPLSIGAGAPVPLKVNALSSVETHLPYEYYKLPFCKPVKVTDYRENLGELLTGNKLENSAYELNVGVETRCRVLCTKKYTKDDVAHFIKRIDEAYVVNWVVDNMPAAEDIVDTSSGADYVFYEHGFYVGGKFDKPADEGDEDAKKDASSMNYYINNHVTITVLTHTVKGHKVGKMVKRSAVRPKKTSRIVGVRVTPRSIAHDVKGEVGEIMDDPAQCSDPLSLHLSPMVIDGSLANADDDGNIRVVWTYDVRWQKSDVKWASRWDVYLSMGNRYADDVHWFSIINSVLIAVFLTGMVGLILVRTLHKDLLFYNRNMTDEEKQEQAAESGWKLVHAEVFRPPANGVMAFSVLVGTATQLFLMLLITLCFAVVGACRLDAGWGGGRKAVLNSHRAPCARALSVSHARPAFFRCSLSPHNQPGFLSPANRGSLMIAIVLLFVVMGVPAGYASARTYKMHGGQNWQRAIIAQSVVYPSLIFVQFFVIDLGEWFMESAAAVPFFSMFAVLALWLGISVPLTFIGAHFGYRAERIEQPCRTSQGEPREIPAQPWYMSCLVTSAIGGILPFGAFFVEMFFIFSALWLGQ